MRAHQTKRMRKYINMEAEFEAGGWLDEGPGSGRVSPGLFEDEEEFSNPLNYCGDDSTAAGGEAVNTPDKTHEKTLEEKRNEVGGADPSLYLGPSPSAPMSGIGLNDDKAGMEGLDKARINQIILEASKGSKYYENEVKKEKQVSKRIDGMLKKTPKYHFSTESNGSKSCRQGARSSGGN